jgi:dTDP-4-dehydrorhamnose 3,5-epimerase
MRKVDDVEGVIAGRVARHADERGSFRELWRGSEQGTGFVQANLSVSAPWVLRGLHLHRRQFDRWVVASGRAFVAFVDLRAALARPLSDEAPAVDVAVRTIEADDTIMVPIGVAHGFLALEPLDLIYFVTNEYDGSDELGFAWDDPDAAVPWPPIPTPDGRPILSGRDSANPSLRELVRSLLA